jgi:hypothetical protein
VGKKGVDVGKKVTKEGADTGKKGIKKIKKILK